MPFPPPTDAQRVYMGEWARAVEAFEEIMRPARVKWEKASAEAAAIEGGRVTPRELAVWLTAGLLAGEAFRAIHRPAADVVDAANAAAKETTNA